MAWREPEEGDVFSLWVEYDMEVAYRCCLNAILMLINAVSTLMNAVLTHREDGDDTEADEEETETLTVDLAMVVVKAPGETSSGMALHILLNPSTNSALFRYDLQSRDQDPREEAAQDGGRSIL